MNLSTEGREWIATDTGDIAIGTQGLTAAVIGNTMV